MKFLLETTDLGVGMRCFTVIPKINLISQKWVRKSWRPPGKDWDVTNKDTGYRQDVYFRNQASDQASRWWTSLLLPFKLPPTKQARFPFVLQQQESESHLRRIHLKLLVSQPGLDKAERSEFKSRNVLCTLSSLQTWNSAPVLYLDCQSFSSSPSPP